MNDAPLASRYTIGSKLGAGGFGEVYAATDRLTGDQVAIKFYGAREAWAAALKSQAVEHPNVVPVLAAGEHEGTGYIVMPLVEGGNLAENLGNGTLTPRAILSLLEDVAAALDALHRIGIVHRDVKPGNIMVTDEDRPRAVLLDIGSGDAGGAGAVAAFSGTPAYAAPETFKEGNASPATDVYALAAVLAECITANRLFSRPSYEETVQAHLERDAPLIEGGDAVSAALSPVLEKGLALDPHERYATASELIAAARQALDRLPPALVDQPVGHGDSNYSPPTTVHDWE